MIRRFAGAILSALVWLGRLPGVQWLKRRAIGRDPRRFPRRAISGLVILLLAISTFGIWRLATAGAQATDVGSLPYLRPVLAIATSSWTYAILMLVLYLRIRSYRRSRYAELAADTTGYSVDEVTRLAYEALRPDGTRVTCDDEDGVEAIEARILDGLETGEDSRLAINEAALQNDDEDGLKELEEASGEGFELVAEREDADELREGSGEDFVDDHISWLAEWKHVRMDLAATLDASDLAWRFGLPAVVTLLILLLVSRIWVQVWLYPVFVAIAVLVGLINYLRIQRKRRRRLETLREEDGGTAWGDTAAIVKEIETSGSRMCYGFHAGQTYAHPERDTFARELAKRMHETVNDVARSPSIMEKYAHQLEQLLPDLDAFRDDEKKRIMQELRGRVGKSSIGIVPKAALIEDVIETEPVERSVVSTATGSGYDPELVREAYKEMVPAALVEEAIELDRPGDRDPPTVTAVRLREDPLPPEYSEIRAAFTTQFGAYADADPLYQLPEVDEALDREPVYAGGEVEPVGAGGSTHV